MKKSVLIIVFIVLTALVSYSQTVKPVISKKDSITKDSIYRSEMKIIKMSDMERKKQEYFEHQVKQEKMDRNIKTMDKSIENLQKQSALIDSLLKRKK